jgi:hypothetical protein
MGSDGDAVAFPIGRNMQRHRSIRRRLGRRLVAARRSFTDGALADGDNMPFEERDLDIAAGADEKPFTASEVAAR